jgi:type IV secretion system protein VirB9
MKILTSLLIYIFLISTAFAESPQYKSKNDRRILMVNYNPLDVVNIEGHYGYSTQVQFAPDEEIVGIAAGDSLAWEVAPVKNHLFLKPRTPGASTNLNVVTNERVYQFSLDGHKSLSKDKSNDMMFLVIFVYPQEKQIAHLDNTLLLNSAAKTKPAVQNRNYDIRTKGGFGPTEVYDDGIFTWFKFPAGMKIPAIYAKTSDKKEAITNFHISDTEYVVVHELAPSFVIRFGKSETKVINRDFGKYASGNKTGAISPLVRRTTVGEDL